MLKADNRRMRSLLSEAQRSLITLLMVFLWLLWFQEAGWGWQWARRLFSGTYQLNETIIHVISSAAAPFSHILQFNLSAKGRGYCTDSNLNVANASNKLSCLNCHFCVYGFITVSTCKVTGLKLLLTADQVQQEGLMSEMWAKASLTHLFGIMSLLLTVLAAVWGKNAF